MAESVPLIFTLIALQGAQTLTQVILAKKAPDAPELEGTEQLRQSEDVDSAARRRVSTQNVPLTTLGSPGVRTGQPSTLLGPA